MRIGLDLDGTIVVYDDVFHRHAIASFGLPADVPVDKTAVRDWLRANEPGEAGWIELQRLVYGLRMEEARLAPGIDVLFAESEAAGVAVSIVSHKTQWSVAEPRVDLRAAALAWLDAARFFAPGGFGVERARVFFESTRADKLARIASEDCRLFVDDLVEVLEEPGFPAGVERWLYAPQGAGRVAAGIRPFENWREPAHRVHELAGAHADRA